MKYFKLPDLGEGLPEAEIVQWHVKIGDSVSTDQLLVSVETAKAIVDVPSPVDGEIAALFGDEGDIVHTGEPLVEYVGEGEDTGTVVGKLDTTSQEAAKDHFIIGASNSSLAKGSMKATPAVRALATRLNVDLTKVTPSGRDGLITADDVQRAHKLTTELGASEKIRGVRRSMAKNMARSHAEVVPVSIYEDADIDHWPKDADATIQLAQAIAYACQQEPALNVWFDADAMSRRLLESVDLGIAVDTPDGLFVPVLRNIYQRDAEDLRSGLNRLREDVASRKIPPQELQGASITLSNFGTMAGRYANPIVVPPQVAILGAGVIRKDVVVVTNSSGENQIAVHKIVPLSLTFDHRAVTGGEAARFLKAIITKLEE